MAHKEPYEQLTGPVTVYVALWTNTLEIPEVDVTPSAPWVELGDTDGDQSVHHGGALTYFRDNTYQGPRKAVRPEETVMYGFTLVGLTLENYAQIMSAVVEMGEATTAAGNGTQDLPLERGFAPPRYALLFRGEVNSPYGPYPAQYVAEEGVFDGEPLPVYVKDARPMIDVEFVALEELGYLTVQLPLDVVLAATSLGLYRSTDFAFNNSDATWARLGGEQHITHFAVNADNPEALQVATIGVAYDNAIYIRRPGVTGDNWQLLLTRDQGWNVINAGQTRYPDQENFGWVTHNPVTSEIHIVFSAKNVGDKFMLSTSDYGATWRASAMLPVGLRYVAGKIAVDSEGNIWAGVCNGFGAAGRIVKTASSDANFVSIQGLSGGGWTPHIFIGPSDIVYAGEYSDEPGSELLSSAAIWGQIDGAFRAGTISNSSTGYVPNSDGWINPNDGDVIRTIRASDGGAKLYYSDDGWETGALRVIPELPNPRVMIGNASTQLIFGRGGATEDNPHLVFATDDDGATIWGKGGPHADQADGGGDSIPYAASVAWNGICIV